ncbi:hypothetical protein GCM10027040_35530 [Halomonas shantousis]
MHMQPKKWDVWIVLVWVLATLSALCATFIIIRHGVVKLPAASSSSGSSGNSYNYFIIIGSIGLALAIILLAIISSMINDDFKSVVNLYNRLKSDSAPSSLLQNGEKSDRDAPNTQLALKVLRMSYNSPLRGHISEKAVIYNINRQHVTTAAEANRALVKGNNEILWKDTRGRLQTSIIEINENDLRAHFEQRYRPPD